MKETKRKLNVPGLERVSLHRSSGGEMGYEGEVEEPQVNDPRAKKDLQDEKAHLDAGHGESDLPVSTLRSNF